MEYNGVCDTGLKRAVNQDAIYMAGRDDIGIFCVADGMGGHSHGELASREIVKQTAAWWGKFDEAAFEHDFSRMMHSLNQALACANRNIYNMAGRGTICGSTAVVLFLYRERYGILSAGDSRIYLYDRMRVKQLTVDEVWENQTSLHMSKEMIRTHPNRGRLVNAVGIDEEIKITSSTDHVRDGMVFMLCSDGLYKMCPERAMTACLKKCRKVPPAAITGRLLQMVYDSGAADNVSIILVKT